MALLIRFKYAKMSPNFEKKFPPHQQRPHSSVATLFLSFLSPTSLLQVIHTTVLTLSPLIHSITHHDLVSTPTIPPKLFQNSCCPKHQTTLCCCIHSIYHQCLTIYQHTVTFLPLVQWQHSLLIFLLVLWPFLSFLGGSFILPLITSNILIFLSLWPSSYSELLVLKK